MESDRLRTGKLPSHILEAIVLQNLGVARPETLVRAAVGVDAAAIAADEDWAWVLTSDPITTARSGAGRLAVHVVCNDLAAMGAEPVGLLSTLLFPAGATVAELAEITGEICDAAEALNVEVLGGHTEVAPGLSSPLVVMSGIGKARRDRLMTAAGAKPGDALVLTKAAALEGTHILASDLGLKLADLPVSVLEEAKRYGEELSVVPEARLAVDLGATAMHDPTEGGIVGAAWEMAEASGCGFRMAASAIPVREPTRLICAALDVDPLRLIASGALLIACRDASRMLRGLRDGGIAATHIGEMTAEGRVLVYDDHVETVDYLDRDELYRVLEASTH